MFLYACGKYNFSLKLKTRLLVDADVAFCVDLKTMSILSYCCNTITVQVASLFDRMSAVIVVKGGVMKSYNKNDA